MSDRAYWLEVRPLYTERDTPWAPVPGSEFTTFEDRLDHLRDAAHRTPPETIVRVRGEGVAALGGSASHPRVMASLRLDDGRVVTADRIVETMGGTLAAVLADVVFAFPRVAAMALCDVVGASRLWDGRCEYIDGALDRMRAWATCPTEAARIAVVDAVGHVGDTLTRRWPDVDTDRARAVIHAAAAMPRGALLLTRLPAEVFNRTVDAIHGGAHVRSARPGRAPGDVSAKGHRCGVARGRVPAVARVDGDRPGVDPAG